MLESFMTEFLPALISYGKEFPWRATCQNLLCLQEVVSSALQLTVLISSWDFNWTATFASDCAFSEAYSFQFSNCLCHNQEFFNFK